MMQDRWKLRVRRMIIVLLLCWYPAVEWVMMQNAEMNLFYGIGVRLECFAAISLGVIMGSFVLWLAWKRGKRVVLLAQMAGLLTWIVSVVLLIKMNRRIYSSCISEYSFPHSIWDNLRIAFRLIGTAQISRVLRYRVLFGWIGTIVMGSIVVMLLIYAIAIDQKECCRKKKEGEAVAECKGLRLKKYASVIMACIVANFADYIVAYHSSIAYPFLMRSGIVATRQFDYLHMQYCVLLVGTGICYICILFREYYITVIVPKISKIHVVLRIMAAVILSFYCLYIAFVTPFFLHFFQIVCKIFRENHLQDYVMPIAMLNEMRRVLFFWTCAYVLGGLVPTIYLFRKGKKRQRYISQACITAGFLLWGGIYFHTIFLPETCYEYAITAMERKEYEKAIHYLEQATSYEDGELLLLKCEDYVAFNKAKYAYEYQDPKQGIEQLLKMRDRSAVFYEAREILDEYADYLRRNKKYEQAMKLYMVCVDDYSKRFGTDGIEKGCEREIHFIKQCKEEMIMSYMKRWQFDKAMELLQEECYVLRNQDELLEQCRMDGAFAYLKEERYDEIGDLFGEKLVIREENYDVIYDFLIQQIGKMVERGNLEKAEVYYEKLMDYTDVRNEWHECKYQVALMYMKRTKRSIQATSRIARILQTKPNAAMKEKCEKLWEYIEE